MCGKSKQATPQEKMQNKENSVQTENRPPLDTSITAQGFCSFYWLKEELTVFCREHRLSSAGSKEELRSRIEKFLTSGTIEQKKPRRSSQKIARKPKQEQLPSETLSIHSIITKQYRSDQAHRAFFQAVIGPHFHFTTHFMNFMKENVGKTYQDAIDEWHREREFKKDPAYRSQIAPQFEYNQYIRAYFEHNPEKTLQDAIASWNSRKKARGSTAYSPDDE